MRPVEWQASPRHVRVFHGGSSTVIDRVELDSAARLFHRVPDVMIQGFTFDEQTVLDMRSAMSDAYFDRMQDMRMDAARDAL